MQLRAVCRTLRSTVTAIQDTAQYKQRLLVVDFEHKEPFEFDPVTAALRLHPNERTSQQDEKDTTWWPTSIALCPYNGDFYTCQYVVRLLGFHGCHCKAVSERRR